MKALSVLISATLLVLIVVFVVIIINAWAGGTVRLFLDDAVKNYQQTSKTIGSVFGKIFGF